MNSNENNSLDRYLAAVRTGLRRGDTTTQPDLYRLIRELEDSTIVPRLGDTAEVLELVDSFGSPTSLVAPRWLCHLLGLRHVCAHVILSWQSLSMGRVFVLQVRSWTKRDSPGHIEVSVGGHVKAGHSALETARIEMKQELGVSASDLDGEGLRHVASYESFNEKPSLRFYNSEWREVYVGELTLAQLARLRFEQAEVAGLLMCPEREVRSLLHQQRIPLTSSLKLSMPLCLREDS